MLVLFIIYKQKLSFLRKHLTCMFTSDDITCDDITCDDITSDGIMLLDTV